MRKVCNVILLGSLAALILIGCAEEGTYARKEAPAAVWAAQSEKAKPEHIHHKVMDGETMATIAKWYAGDKAYWVEIAEENPGMKPTELKEGEVLKIPVSMAKVHQEQSSHSTGYIYHKVMDEETMATIAKWYSGNKAYWVELAEKNPELKPTELKEDEVVRVPVSMAKIHEEQPGFSTGFIYHRVKYGETMATIAKWYSGNKDYWVELEEENPGMKPTDLQEGDVVRVPVSMAKVHEEQPSYSTATGRPKSTKKTLDELYLPQPKY
jgi:DNA-directed RNA polymerase subunit H (RpoH/RPB5)